MMLHQLNLPQLMFQSVQFHITCYQTFNLCSQSLQAISLSTFTPQLSVIFCVSTQNKTWEPVTY